MEVETDHLQQDEEFWLQDGNVILISQHTTFRVHQSVLSRNSDVFRDLFTVPQPAIEERLFDCRIIRLPESPADLRYLLRVLYDGRSFYLGRADRLQFEEVEALVRLSQKYQIYDLRERGLARLKMVLTHDFIVWDRHGRDTFLLDSEDTLQIAIKDEEGIMAINLARLTGALSMLPMAFYLCSNLTPSELIRGVTRQDGTVERLSADDLAACMEGRVRLTTANTVGNASIYLQNSPACSRRPLCADSFKRFLRIGLIFSPTDSISHHSLHQRDGSLNNICENDKVCWDCITFLMTSDYERRRKLWEILPSIFGLEDWKHLRAAESA